MWYSGKLYRTGIEHLNGRQNRLSGNEDEINMKILAIFTCFNRKELTKRGMATLSENKDVTFDYVILDDNSSDGTREMLKQMRDDGTYQIDLIEGDGSNFWNGGMHKAIEHIKNTHMDYDYYMLMNDDTKFFPGILMRWHHI